MDSLRLLSIILLSVTYSEANQYFVGGGKEIGWNDNPKKESYNHWSKKTRFAVNDTIVFTYPLGKDNVLYVREEDYKECNNKNPVKTWNDGYTEVNLFRTGIYHFIGGNEGSCQMGQRLIVFVPEIQPPAARTPAAAPSPLSPPLPSTPPPSTQTTPSPAPSIHSPLESSPSPAPSIHSPPESSPSSAVTPPAPATPSGPEASAPQPSTWQPPAPAPAPSSAWPIATRSLLVPSVGLLFVVLFH